MAIDPLKFAVDQITRVLESMGWNVANVSYEGNYVTVIINKPKEKILKP